MYIVTEKDLSFKKITQSPIIDTPTRKMQLDVITNYVDTGMPKISNELSNSVCFICHDGCEAPSATGFFVTKNKKVYLITNQHVLDDFNDDENIIIYYNTHNNFTMKKDCFLRNKNDLDVVVAAVDNVPHISAIDAGIFAKIEDIKDENITIGDDIFMLGFYVDGNNNKEVNPAAKFGNISKLPTLTQNEYYMDMRSRDGFSGSPVFMYRTPFSDITKKGIMDFNIGQKTIFKLIGIHYAQIQEFVKVKKIQTEDICVGSGVTCVIPSWVMMDMLNEFG